MTIKENPKKEDHEFEIRFLEGILRQRPNFIQALAALGDLYTKVGRYQEGLTVDERLLHLVPDDPIVLYNLACSYSLTGSIDKAFITLQKAAACGYNDFEHLQHDDDLKLLREDSRFQEFLVKLKKEIPK